MKNFKIFKFLLISSIASIILSNTITLPLNYLIDNSYNKSDIKSIFKYYNKGQLITSMQIGSEKINTYFQLTFNYFSTVVLNSSVIDQNSNLFYNINNSKTHVFLDDSKIKFKNEPAKSGYLIFDNFNINSNLTNIKINFLLSINQNNQELNTSVLGLGLNNIKDYSYPEFNFINQLKNKSLISEYTISISMNNKNNGELIIGEYPDEYAPEKYKKENRIEIPAAYLYYSVNNYYLLVNRILSNNIVIIEEKNILLDLNSGFIEGSDGYREIVEKNFFNNEPNCHKEIGPSFEYFYYCDKEIDVTKIPSLIFEIKNYNFNLTLQNKDLFELIDDKLFFIVVFKVRSPLYWRVGYYGLRNFLITYNQDKKTVTFYEENINKQINENENKNNDLLLWVIVTSLIIIFIIVVGWILYYFMKNKSKIIKKRANELDDDFIYESKNNNNKDELGLNNDNA